MKRTTKHTDKKALHEQIMKSMISSFRMEGINISNDSAKKILDKIELNLGK